MGTGNNLSGAKHAPEGFIDHNETELPICPHCGYELHLDEAYKNVVVAGGKTISEEDSICIDDALRMDEPTDFTVRCPSCDWLFILTATLAVRFTSKKGVERHG